MELMSHLALLAGLYDDVDDERGLSQSTETALLVAAAFAIASAIFLAVNGYVGAELGKLGKASK